MYTCCTCSRYPRFTPSQSNCEWYSFRTLVDMSAGSKEPTNPHHATALSFPKSWHTPFFYRKKNPDRLDGCPKLNILSLGHNNISDLRLGFHGVSVVIVTSAHDWNMHMGSCWRPCWLLVWLLLRSFKRRELWWKLDFWHQGDKSTTWGSSKTCDVFAWMLAKKMVQKEQSHTVAISSPILMMDILLWQYVNDIVDFVACYVPLLSVYR